MEETSAGRVRRPPLARDRPRLVVLPLRRAGVGAAAGAGGRPGDAVRRPGPADVGAAQVAVPAGADDTGTTAQTAGTAGRTVSGTAGCRCPDRCCPTRDGAGDGAGAGTGVDPPSSARVEIAAGGHAVVVDAPEPLDRVADTAMRLWTATDTPDVVRGFGYTMQVDGPLFVDLTAEVDLPRRMTEGTDE